jgi:hypothetical protein
MEWEGCSSRSLSHRGSLGRLAAFDGGNDEEYASAELNGNWLVVRSWLEREFSLDVFPRKFF